MAASRNVDVTKKEKLRWGPSALPLPRGLGLGGCPTQSHGAVGKGK